MLEPLDGSGGEPGADGAQISCNSGRAEVPMVMLRSGGDSLGGLVFVGVVGMELTA